MPVHGFTALLLWLFLMWRVVTPATRHPPVIHCKLMQNTAECNRRQLSSIPVDLPNTIEELQLNHNLITTLPEDSLLAYPSLKTLSLACNHLEKIEPMAFLEVQMLTSLNVANNDIHVGHQESAVALKTLQELSSLDLSENKLDEEMAAVLLQNLTSVEYLNLSGNLIQRLDENILSHLHQLKELDLQRNALFEIDDAFHSNLKLQRLNLAFNYLPCLTDFHMTHLVVLNASYNSIDWFISRQDVNETFQLETLDISHNNLLFFPFLPSRSRLQNLYLAYNRLSFYEHWADNSTYPNMTTTVEFYNLKNYGANVSAQLWLEDLHGEVSSLRILDLRGNSVSYLPRRFIQKMPLLSRLKMCQNCLKILNFTSERFSGHLYELDVSRNQLNHIEADEDSLIALSNLTFFNLSQNNLKMLPPRLFTSLSSLRSVDISFNLINICLSEPTNDFAGCVIWEGLTSLKKLFLKGCNIKMIPNSAFSGMALTHLELSDNLGINVQNSLQTLQRTLQHLGLGNTQSRNVDFAKFKSLTFLNLSSNSLSAIPQSLLQISLKSLDFRNNHLTSIPSAQADALAPSLRAVFLTGNPFNCCHTEWFRTFETQQTLCLVDKSDIKCCDLFHRALNVESLDPLLCAVEGESVFWYIMLFLPICVFLLGVFIIVLLTVKPKGLQKSIKKNCLKPTSY